MAEQNGQAFVPPATTKCNLIRANGKPRVTLELPVANATRFIEFQGVTYERIEVGSNDWHEPQPDEPVADEEA